MNKPNQSMTAKLEFLMRQAFKFNSEMVKCCIYFVQCIIIKYYIQANPSICHWVLALTN